MPLDGSYCTTALSKSAGKTAHRSVSLSVMLCFMLSRSSPSHISISKFAASSSAFIDSGILMTESEGLYSASGIKLFVIASPINV